MTDIDTDFRNLAVTGFGAALLFISLEDLGRLREPSGFSGELKPELSPSGLGICELEVAILPPKTSDPACEGSRMGLGMRGQDVAVTELEIRLA